MGETMKNTHIIFDKLNQLDYSTVEYKLKSEKFSEKEISKMKKECLRFLSLCAEKKIALSPSYMVDMYWHQLILCTKIYEEVGKICGKFIHHIPNNGNKIQRKKDSEAFWKTIESYEESYGEPNLKIWGIERR